VTSPRAAMLSSVADCRAAERNTLLDPCFDRPEEHLTFEESGLCVPITDRGSLTIMVLDLNRGALTAERRAAWLRAEHLLKLYVLTHISNPSDVQSLQERMVELLS